MQPFDVIPTTSPSVSVSKSENPFVSEKPPKGGESFGDMMHRALNAPSGETNPNEAEAGAEQPVKAADAKPAYPDHHTHHTGKSKKASHRPTAKKTNDATTSNAATVIVCNPHISQMVPTPVHAATDEGSSESASDSENPQVTATGNSDSAASQSINAQFLALAGSLGVSLPQASATMPTAVPSTTTASKEQSKGSSSPVSKVSSDAAASKGADKITSETVTVQSDDEIPTELLSQHLAETAASKADFKDMAAKPAGKLPKPPAPEENAAVSGTTATVVSAPADSLPAKSAPTDTVATLPQPPSDAQITKAKVSADPLPVPSADLGGTYAAKQYTAMKKAEKTTKVAGQAEQDLPSNASTGSAELSTGQKGSVHALPHANEKLNSTAAVEPSAARVSTTPEPAAATVTSAAISPAAPADSRMRVLERTHDIVALHAMRLAQTSSDSLHVVVKPGDGMQISLELRQSESGIEVHASLHKGDFEHLNQYWPELQQRLETRGVRVGTLTTSDNFTSTSNQQFQQSKKQSHDHDSLAAGAFAEFALAGSMSEAPAARAARATAYRGWETWA
jgi:hypothetical protein